MKSKWINRLGILAGIVGAVAGIVADMANTAETERMVDEKIQKALATDEEEIDEEEEES